MHAHLWRSLNHALVLTIAAVLTAIAWYSIRLPDASLLLVNAAMLGANVAYDIENDAERTSLLFLYFFSAGILQFVLALLWKFPFFQSAASVYGKKSIDQMLRDAINNERSGVVSIFGGSKK